ncbi:MAG: metal ABC transporter substrate-binding protein [Xanthobacteraceae bacterium]
MSIIRFLLVPALLALQFVSSPAVAQVKVVASFSILGDLVQNVGGERVEVTLLVGPDTDLHVYQPSPADAKRLLDARLVVINGLGLEGWADRLVKASGFKGRTVVASRGIKAKAAAKHGHGHGGKPHAHSRNDPHSWQDVANVKIYVANIRDALIAADARGKSYYEAAASAYLTQLDALDAEIKAIFAGIPNPRRRVITSHEAFAYYSGAYDITFLAAQGVGGNTEPSAKGIATLIRQIKREGVKAIFIENISNPRVIQRVAKETGAAIGGTLYSDALSDAGGPAPTYITMMQHNTRLLANAMK